MAVGGFGSGAVELGVGYVSVVPNAAGFQKELDKQIAQAGAGASKAGERAGQQMSSGMSKALKVGGAAAGAAAVAGIGVAITKGFSRLNQIDQARAKLSGLGHEAGSVEKIMDSALTAVKGTAFGMGDAATVAAATVAAGVKPGQELERTLKLMGDAATIAGTDMATMGSIVNKVATSDMMQMDVANQLMDAGIPILQMVADEMGVTAGEARKLASEGKVSFETFQNALDSGLGGAALKSGETLQGSLNNLMASVGRLGEAMLKPFMGEGKGLIASLTGLSDMLTDNVGPAMENFAGWLANTAVPALRTAGEWIQRNRDWLAPLAVAVGTAAVAWGAWTGAIKLWAAIVKAGIAIQAAWNAVMAANPIMLAVMAIGALVAGLTYFFAKTETGQRIWGRFMDSLEPAKQLFKDIIDFGKMIVDILFRGDFNGDAPFGLEEDSGVVNFLFTLRDTVLSVWEGIKTAFTTAWDVIQGIFTGFKFAFAVVLTAAVLWFNGIKWYWTQVANIVVWAWNSLIKPAWDAMQVGLQALGSFFSWVWTAVIKPAWDALGAGISWVWAAVIKPVWDALRAALGTVGAAFQFYWNNVIKPAWSALGAGIALVWNSVIRPAWDALKAALGVVGTFFQNTWSNVIKPAWDALGNGIRAVVNNIIMPAWDAMKRGLDTIKGHFETAVSAITSVWDTLSGALRKPIDFLINVVWNRGLVPAWNTVQGFLPGLPRANPMPGFAVGGAVFGPGTGTSDSIVARLSRGEHVLTAAEVKALGGHDKVYAMREMIRKGVWPAGHGVGMPAFARGGEVDDTPKGGVRLSPTPGEGGLQPIAILAKRLIHRIWPSITTIGGYRQDAYPEHPSGRALDVMVGVGNPIGDEVTSWALANNAVLPLIHALWKQTVWMPNGATQPMGDRGSPTQNHMDHPHLWYHPKSIDPNVIPDGLVGHDGLTAADRLAVIKDKIKEILDKALDPIKSGMATAIGTPPPPYLDIPPQGLTRTKDTAVDTAFEFVENIGDGLKEVYNVAKGVTATVTGLFRDNGGFIPAGKSIVNNETGKPEAVLNWEQLQQVIRLMESAAGLAALQEWAHGDPTAAIAQGVSEDTVKAVEAVGERIAAEVAVMTDTFEKTWRDGMLEDALGVFGVGQVGGTVGAAMKALADPDLLKPKTQNDSSPASSGVSTALPGAADFGYENTTVDLETRMPDLDTSSPGSGPVKDQVKAAFAAYGWDKDPYWAAVDWIVGKESTWNPTARNPSSGAFGLFQFLGGTKQQYLPDENTNPKVQGAAGAKYIKDRYGDPLKAKAFWEQNGWYDRGGWLKPGVTLTRNDTGKPEAILNPAQWSMISRQIDVVEQMANGSSGATYNVYATDVDEAMKRLKLREAQRAQTFMGAR